jgi:hypothetical protein
MTRFFCREMQLEYLLRSCKSLTYWKLSQYFMEPEGSLPCSQQSATGSYPEPDQSSPYYLILSKIHFNTLPTYIYVFLIVAFLLAFPPKWCAHSSPTCVLHAQAISFAFTRSFELYLAKSTSYEVLHYAVFSTSCHFIPLGSKYFYPLPVFIFVSLFPRY